MEEEKTATHNNHNHITMVLDEVGMLYSHPVIFHVFPVVKRRENKGVVSKDNRYYTYMHHWGMWKRVGLRKEKTATHNNHNHITMSLEDVGMHHSRSVMFQVFPVVKRRENMAVIRKNNRYCTHHWDMRKRMGLTA